ncbi:hypothetical protein GCM10022389_17630 [Flavobacterium cheonanense]|uniref:Uncharacterized protein n=2 Tax=Flavobacterium cheonanense TaxID=706183 RepID=A0ABP7VRD3_9FLAO
MAFKESSNSYQTECISLETDGYISFKIWDTKSGKSYKPEQAREDAIHAILFAGIAGGNGCSTQTALLIKSEDIDKFKKIEKYFFGSKGKWAQFTRSSATETTLPVNLGEKNWKVYQVSVSKDALKKYLVEKSILKSINTGF